MDFAFYNLNTNCIEAVKDPIVLTIVFACGIIRVNMKDRKKTARFFSYQKICAFTFSLIGLFIVLQLPVLALTQKANAQSTGILPDPYTINGTVFIDNNKNGVQDSGEGGYSGARINIYGGLYSQASTDSSGNYAFNSLKTSWYSLYLIVPASYKATTSTYKGISVSSSNPHPTANFGINAIPTHSISGSVYLDSNKNGLKDSGETGYSGATVKIYGKTNKSLVTDSSGNYTARGLVEGGYSVNLTLPSGYSATTAKYKYVSLYSNQAIDFGVAPILTHSLSGKVFVDANRNSVQDNGEHAYNGARINLSGRAYKTSYTNTDGIYAFSGLVEGWYNISVSIPSDYKATTATYKYISLYSDQTMNFGIVSNSSLCVQVVTYARNPFTGECKAFSTQCDVPSSWLKVSSCPVPTPTSIPCSTPPSVTNLLPNGTVNPGTHTLSWNPVNGAKYYSLRIDDKNNGWAGTCSMVNSGDVCRDITTNSYTYTFQAGHTYTWWVHARNSCGDWGPSTNINVTVADLTLPTSYVILSKSSRYINGENITITFRGSDSGSGLKIIHTALVSNVSSESEAKSDMTRWNNSYQGVPNGGTRTATTPFYLEYLAEDKSRNLESTHKLLITGSAVPAGQFCGGFAGISCPSGYYCKYDGNYPDAGGVCVRSWYY